MESKKFRVAFVCLGNACRSQMAEGFARQWAGERIEVHSAGLFPAVTVPAQTRRMMQEKGIDISDQFPKAFSLYPPGYFDLVVNMSGMETPGHARVVNWKVEDPYGASDRRFRQVRDQIERQTEELLRGIREGLEEGQG